VNVAEESNGQTEETLNEQLAKVKENIQSLPKKLDVLTVAAERLGDVLPVQFYSGNSELVVTGEERETLSHYREVQDEDIEIRPEGLIYAEHMYYRNALTEAFGPGGWALLPGSGIQIEKDGNRTLIFQRWVLRVHGAFVGEAIGSGSYWSNNAGQDKGDAAESAQSNALTRICAKSSLGIGTNPWNRRFQREWKKKYAVQVSAKVYNSHNKTWEVKKLWRRSIESGGEPFPHEIELLTKPVTGPAAAKVPLQDHSRANNQPGPTSVGPLTGALEQKPLDRVEASGSLIAPSSREAVTPEQPIAAPAPAPQTPRPRGRPPKAASAIPQADAPAAQAKPVAVDSSGKCGQPEFVYFMARCRKTKLVEYSSATQSDDSTKAYQWLCEHLGVRPEDGRGTTVTERMRNLLFTQTREMWNKSIVPSLRELPS